MMEYVLIFSCFVSFVIFEFFEVSGVQSLPLINQNNGLGIRCKMLEMDGKSLRGFERLTPPIMDELCVADGQSNCQGLFGENLSYCQDVCCKPRENHAEEDFLTIKCINLNINDKIIQGFERSFPPIQNDTCYDDDGFSNCETLLEPERSFCTRKCCIDSFARSTPPPPNKNPDYPGKMVVGLPQVYILLFIFSVRGL